MKIFINQEKIALTKTSYTFALKTCLFQHSHESRSLGEGLISLEECSKIINSFPLNKVPGNDGLPIEFYKTFWNFLGDPLVECFNASFVQGGMSPSQRQAVITLIEKKDQDGCDLQNWRPISLLNVDTKIASKVIARKNEKSIT